MNSITPDTIDTSTFGGFSYLAWVSDLQEIGLKIVDKPVYNPVDIAVGKLLETNGLQRLSVKLGRVS